MLQQSCQGGTNIGARLVVKCVAVESRAVGSIPLINFAGRVRVLNPLLATNALESIFFLQTFVGSRDGSPHFCEV